MDKKIRAIYVLPPEDTPQVERYTQTKSKGMENIFYANGKGKKAGVAIFISEKINFKTKAIIRDKGDTI